jgi:hypothetical protein
MRGESRIGSQLLYMQPGILEDGILEERRLGIAAGHSWLLSTEAVVVYVDRGISQGMREAIGVASAAGVPVELRLLLRATAEAAE